MTDTITSADYIQSILTTLKTLTQSFNADKLEEPAAREALRDIDEMIGDLLEQLDNND